MGICEGCGRDTKTRKYCDSCRLDAHAIKRVRAMIEKGQLTLDGLLSEAQAESLQTGLDALEETTKKHAQLVARLVPIVQALAEARGAKGVTVSDLRLHLEERGITLPNKKQRDLSFLGHVMREAGLKHSGQYRRSAIKKSHGNVQAVWIV